MEALQRDDRSTRRRRSGQTLVEFALTLPILLLLLFGIIEFGRIFQSWVTLQNAARAAARYATTGQFSQQYAVNINTNGADDPNSIVPCVASATDERGLRTVYVPNNPANYRNHIEGFEQGPEMLYATWYGGDDCDPASDQDQNNRKDLLRILSIIEEARRGAAGLAVGPIPFLTTPPPIGADAYRNITVNDWRQVPWFHIWDRPLPNGTIENARLNGSDLPGWFDVMICSSREKLDSNNGQAFPLGLDTFTLADRLRFRIVDDASDVGPFEDDGDLYRALVPACLLNELGDDTFETRNPGRPWLDAGGPADVVTIVITFNHPLITPLGIANYLPLQARRSAVNEAFRTSRAANLGQSVPAGPVDLVTPDPNPPDDDDDEPEPTVTPTVIATSTPTSVPASTNTPVPPFTCDGMTVTFQGWLTLNGTGARFALYNPNGQQTRLNRATVQWQKSVVDMRLSQVNFGLSPGRLWDAGDTTPPTDIGSTGTGPAADGAFRADGNPFMPANATVFFDVYFVNVRLPFVENYSQHYFNGSTWYVDHPNQTSDCVLTFNVTPPPPTTPPDTPIPDCLPGLLRVQFVRFLPLGQVQFTITNGRNVAARMVGFNFNWVARRANTPMSYVWAYAQRGAFGSTLIWQSGNVNQDSTPPTRGRNPAAPGAATGVEGIWVENVFLNPGQSINLYMDFEGVTGLLSEVMSRPDGQPLEQDFAGSTFEFLSPECDGASGFGPGGTEQTGVVIPPPTVVAPPTQVPTTVTTPPPPTTVTTRPPTTVTPVTVTTQPPPTTVTPVTTTVPPPVTFDPGGGSND